MFTNLAISSTEAPHCRLEMTWTLKKRAWIYHVAQDQAQNHGRIYLTCREKTTHQDMHSE